jgi:hypothetical protein
VALLGVEPANYVPIHGRLLPLIPYFEKLDLS